MGCLLGEAGARCRSEFYVYIWSGHCLYPRSLIPQRVSISGSFKTPLQAQTHYPASPYSLLLLSRPAPHLWLGNVDSSFILSEPSFLPCLYEHVLPFTLKTTLKPPDDRPPQNVPVPLLAEVFTCHSLYLSYGVNINSSDHVLYPRLSRGWESAALR